MTKLQLKKSLRTTVEEGVRCNKKMAKIILRTARSSRRRRVAVKEPL